VVDDSLLQNTPVEFKVIDQDLYSSELIGVVYIDLNPLIMRTAHGGQSDSSHKDLVIEGEIMLYKCTLLSWILHQLSNQYHAHISPLNYWYTHRMVSAL
jgi:hypothetical protein